MLNLTDPTRTADPLGAGEPGIGVLMAFLAEELYKLHRRLDTLDRHAADLMFLQLSSQHLLIGKRRPFSKDSRDVMIRVLGAEPYKGRCPCCMDARVLAEAAQIAPGAECDHFFHCSLNRRICQSSRQECPDWRARPGLDRLLTG